MLVFNVVSFDFLSAEFAVDCVQIHARSPGDILEGFVNVGAQFFNVAGFADVVARSLDSVARQAAVGIFETANVVALPAVH